MRRQSMRRLARLMAIAAATTFLSLSAAAGAGIVTPHHIDEMFRGTSIDYTNTWAWWGTNQPSYVGFAQTDGALTVSVSAAAQPAALPTATSTRASSSASTPGPHRTASSSA